MAKLQDYDLSKTWTAELVASERITAEQTDEVRSLLLKILAPGFQYQAGQTVGVLIPGPHAFGNPYHLRLYSIAGGHRSQDGSLEIELCVRRCFLIDEVSGERYPGVASQALCDAQPGARFTLTGPYASPFQVPEDSHSNLLMIGTGTGIAPFRAFIQAIYRQRPVWEGQVRLYYGARTGLEMLYQNDRNQDLANYYDQATFRAFAGLSRQPWQGEDTALRRTLENHAQEIWEWVQHPRTHVYLAGLDKIAKSLEQVMVEAAGSATRWSWTRQELMEQGRWAEILYG